MEILLVDDDIRFTQLLQLVFESRGFGVTIANTEAQALEFLERKLPEAILLDLMAPAMSGLEVCKQIRANPRTSTVPVVFLSAKSDQETQRRAEEAGATEYLTKPIRPSDLISRVRAAVNHRTAPVAKA